MKGFGAVVTGTLVAGTIRKEDELEVFPAGKRVRVRGIQVHGQTAEQAVAGQRTALNLAGVTTQELARGMVLAPPSTFHSTSRLDVSLTLLPSAKPLKDRARVHLHAYTFETIATVVLFGQKQISPGETALRPVASGRAHAVVAWRPLHHAAVFAGRDHRRRRGARRVADFSDAGAGGVFEDSGGRRCCRRFCGPALPDEVMAESLSAQLVAETGWTEPAIEIQLADAVRSRPRSARIGDLVVHVPALEGLKSA